MTHLKKVATNHWWLLGIWECSLIGKTKAVSKPHDESSSFSIPAKLGYPANYSISSYRKADMRLRTKYWRGDIDEYHKRIRDMAY